MDTDSIIKALTTRPMTTTLKNKDFLSTGSTLVNLACSGRPFGGILKGSYIFFVGDSSSGKSWFSLQLLAEAARNKNFEDYRFIHDNAEYGTLMDVERFFGTGVSSRIEPPSGDPENPIYSSTVEEFYDHLDDAHKEGKPFIYIMDSMDALTSTTEVDKFEEQKKARRKGTKVAGSYGDGKAKTNSTHLRRAINKLKETGSILIIICQTRDNLGFGFEKKTRSGGNALKFYATLELWTSVVEKIKKKVNDQDRQIGIRTKVQIKKNRITGKEWSVQVPIFHSYGMDDISSCIDFLIKEKHWKKKPGVGFAAPEFDFKGSEEKLIKMIENDGREKELKMLVGTVWREIEEACALKRKPKYE